MRRIGTLSDQSQARRFRNYLLTRGIDSVVNGGSEVVSWEIWVPSEDDVEAARKEFADFHASPTDPRFAVDDQADQIRARKVDQLWKRHSNVQEGRSAAAREIDPATGRRGTDRPREEHGSTERRSPERRSTERRGHDPVSRPDPSQESAAGDAGDSGDAPKSRRRSPGDPIQSEREKDLQSSEPFESRPPLLDSEARQTGFPVTIAIMILSVIASYSTNMGQPRGSRVPGKITMEQQIYNGLSFVDPRDYGPDQDSFASLSKGEIWRIVTPMFLHGNIFHLFFNMFFIFLLGSVIERIHGSFFFLLLALATQSAGMMVQVLLPDAPYMPEGLRGSPFAIGASGVAYGLFGFMWIRPWLDKDYPIELDSTQFMIIIAGLIVCMTPLVPRVANGAHLGGLAAGMLIAAIGYVFRR